MRRIETKYLQFFQHTWVCMEQLCLKLNIQYQIDAKIANTILSILLAYVKYCQVSVFSAGDRYSSNEMSAEKPH